MTGHIRVLDNEIHTKERHLVGLSSWQVSANSVICITARGCDMYASTAPSFVHSETERYVECTSPLGPMQELLDEVLTTNFKCQK